jgi:hypothetical protein
MPIDLTLLYTGRRTSQPERVDLFLPAPGGGAYVVATYIQADHANAIIDAIQDYNIVLDLLRDVVDDISDRYTTAALTEARAYLSTHRP